MCFGVGNCRCCLVFVCVLEIRKQRDSNPSSGFLWSPWKLWINNAPKVHSSLHHFASTEMMVLFIKESEYTAKNICGCIIWKTRHPIIGKLSFNPIIITFSIDSYDFVITNKLHVDDDDDDDVLLRLLWFLHRWWKPAVCVCFLVQALVFYFQEQEQLWFVVCKCGCECVGCKFRK